MWSGYECACEGCFVCMNCDADVNNGFAYWGLVDEMWLMVISLVDEMLLLLMIIMT